jgi:1-acyl-sn-glycerol-3-phosphate acyltransferase
MHDSEHSASRPASLLKTVAMNLWVYPTIIFLTLLGILISPLLIAWFAITTDWNTSRIFRHLVWLYGRAWIWTISPFVTLRKVGFEQFIEYPGSIVVCNHLSYFDVYFMGALPDSRVGLTSRSWPRKMIWYTAFVKGANYIDLEQSDFEQVCAWVSGEHEQGHHTVFFPEGHRSRDGRMHRFHSGAFKAAVVKGIPVIPLCIIGTDDLLPPTRSYLKPCEITLHALPAVNPALFEGEQPHKLLRNHVKSAMKEAIYGPGELQS